MKYMIVLRELVERCLIRLYTKVMIVFIDLLKILHSLFELKVHFNLEDNHYGNFSA